MEINKEMLIAEFARQIDFANFTESKHTVPFRKEFLEYALTLISELTEENERLTRHTKMHDEIIADTVREMVERIQKEAIGVSLLSHPPKFMLQISQDVLLQIEEEMIGETKCGT